MDYASSLINAIQKKIKSDDIILNPEREVEAISTGSLILDNSEKTDRQLYCESILGDDYTIHGMPNNYTLDVLCNNCGKRSLKSYHKTVKGQLCECRRREDILTICKRVNDTYPNLTVLRAERDYSKSGTKKGYNLELHCGKCEIIFARHSHTLYHFNKTDVCPSCKNTLSKLEISVYRALVKRLPQLDIILSARHIIKKHELDIYIPLLRLGIEVDGTYWHSDEHIFRKYGTSAQDYHFRKDIKFAEKGILVIRVLEADLTADFEGQINKLCETIKRSENEYYKQ